MPDIFVLVNQLGLMLSFFFAEDERKLQKTKFSESSQNPVCKKVCSGLCGTVSNENEQALVNIMGSLLQKMFWPLVIRLIKIVELYSVVSTVEPQNYS